MSKNAIILIPAYKPTDTLVTLVDELHTLGIQDILILDDGGGEEFAPIFSQFTDSGKAQVVSHKANLGKGAALKTGLSYIYENYPDCPTAVTADADGQHTAADIANIARLSADVPDALLLGVRQFDQMLPKNRFGNTVTSWVFRIFFGLKITDTQTGLRAIPRDFIPACLEIPYDRYELESEMLLITKGEHVEIVQEPIKTIYIDDNKSSHFNLLVDSSKIYFVMFRYLLASLAAAAVDYLVFYLLFRVSANIALSIAGARLVSLVVNYFLLQYRVFYSRRRVGITFPRYVLLVIFSGVVAATLIEWLSTGFGWNVIATKLLVEIAIYFFNFMMNTTLVFAARRRK